MTEYPQRMSDSWNERMRLIRFRRKKENLCFWEEFKVVPRWLVAMVVVLFLLAETIALLVNLEGYRHGGQIFPPELSNDPVLAELALAGIVLGVSLVFASFILLTGYVNRDAKRRGMSSGLWTFLVIVLFPAYFAIGFIIYFLMREPLPYPCPRCGSTVGARFNFCPNCKCNLRPACPNCKREVVETDKFCPYCAQDLKGGKPAEIPEVQTALSERGGVET
jgi:multisubunit Na+/H+ antiporter MnhC subunit